MKPFLKQNFGTLFNYAEDPWQMYMYAYVCTMMGHRAFQLLKRNKYQILTLAINYMVFEHSYSCCYGNKHQQ